MDEQRTSAGTNLAELSFTVNGDAVQLAVPPLATLLDVLRNDLELTGTKYACGEGECGACSILLDGRLTIEGLKTNSALHPIQSAFVEHGAIQCGFCSPGMIMATYALLQANPSPTEDDIRRALEGNICRCTGYRKIIDAVLSLSKQGTHHG